MTYVSKTAVLGFDSLYTFFHKLSVPEPGVKPKRSIFRSPFASNGIGCAALEVGTGKGAGS